MSGSTTSEEFGSTGRSSTVDMHSEWRSIEQVDNDTPSTSPPYYDSDDSDDGPKPSELYGRHTWKIEKFLTIKKKEQLRGEVFDIGGYKWYILIYPQGCDVDNYLSLFLCVANHEKLLPGWSHLAQFSISVVNKDPKKTKYSDTLHRFWKKEHDWGWKKFMELSKIKDGFIDDEDNLVIKAQVQVIRERTNEPFRCLDYHYRRELVRVYLSNVEQQVCRHFFEEKRNKIFKLIDDKPKWSSFRAFWVGIDRVSKRRISKERTDSVLKLMVKQFFVEKEVTSTLVMDSLNTGLKALKDVQHTKGKTLMGSGSNDAMPDPLVYIDGEDYFVLSDDVINLLDRVKSEPFLYKDDKVSQNGKKDGISGEEYTKDSIESEEWRLTKIGRRTIEIFVLSHIFKIEVLYQEAIALRRQEELIREEEELILNSDLRAKNNKDKRNSSKKKTAKQKRNGKKENKGNKGKEDFTLAGKQITGSTESGKPIPTKPEISETELSDDNTPNSIEIAEIVEITPPKENVSTEIKLQDFAINNNNSNSKGKNSRKVNNRSVININNNNNSNNGEINEKEMVVNQYGETPSHSGRYYSKSSNRGPRSESENLVASLKDRIKLIQQRLVEVEDSLLKDFNAKELSEVFAQTETTGTDSSSSSSPMKNPSRQTLEAKMQKLEKDQQILDNKKQILEKNKQTLVASEETLRRTKELLLRRRNKETTKQAKKDTVPVPTNTIPTNVPVSKTENQKPKQKQIAKEKSTVKSTNTSTGTSNGTTAKVLPEIKTTPSLEISNPPPVLSSNITAKPRVILSQSSPLTIPSDHGLRFGTFNIETLNKSNPTSSGTTSSDKLLLEESSRETLITNTQVGDELEIASSKAVQEEFPHLDIINDLLDEDQQGSGYNQSFFTRQYSVPASHADISPRWTYPVENYYEGFPRVYGSSYDMNMNVPVPPPYSERQLEILRNQNAYISMVRNSNGFSSSPYRLEDYEYSNTTNLGNGGIHNNGYNLYYRSNSTNGNLGPLQS